MCGIGGIINPNAFDLSVITEFTNIIKHRGPDDEGYTVFKDLSAPPECFAGSDTVLTAYQMHTGYQPVHNINNFSNQKAKLALCHRRLSILDLSPLGHQPMSYADGRYWIVYNGEIYNYLEIKDELLALGYQFVSDTDTEVILAAYAVWGEDCLHKFNGMWAFAIYDRTNQTVFFSRDRFGIKPLYYWFSPDGTFYFGSEIKQFTVAAGWQATINSQRAYDYLLYALTDHTDETLFDKVFQLQPGHAAKINIKDLHSVRNGRIDVYKWYNITYGKYKGTFHEAVNEFKYLLHDAVKKHLRADVAVGSCLSGGLDSSSIVCIVNNFLKEEGKQELQNTFSSCSIDAKYDEREWMEEVTRQTNVAAHFVYPSVNNLMEMTPQIIWQQDEPYQSNSVYLGWHVFEESKKNNVTVLLNGQGADEFLAGYVGGYINTRTVHLFKSLKWKSLIAEMKGVQKHHNYSYKQMIKALSHYYSPVFIKNIFRKHSSAFNLNPEWLNIKKLNIKQLHPFDQLNLKAGSVRELSLQQLFCSNLQKLLHWEDRNSMAHSIEARVPFLDYRLVEFVLSLPEEYILKEGITKRILREAMDGILPDKIKNRMDKKGFVTPEERWLKLEDPDLFRAKIKDAVSKSNGIISENAIVYLDKMIKGEIPFDYSYWRIIQFAEWMHVYNIKIAA